MNASERAVHPSDPQVWRSALSCPFSGPSVGHIHLGSGQTVLKILCIPVSNHPQAIGLSVRGGRLPGSWAVPSLLSSIRGCSDSTPSSPLTCPILSSVPPYLSPFALPHLYNRYSKHSDKHNVLDAIPPVSTLNSFLSRLISPSPHAFYNALQPKPRYPTVPPLENDSSQTPLQH